MIFPRHLYSIVFGNADRVYACVTETASYDVETLMTRQLWPSVRLLNDSDISPFPFFLLS